MSLWYFLENDQPVGPFSQTEAQGYVRAHPDTLAWRDGMPEWVAVASIGELAGGSASPASKFGPQKPPPSTQRVAHDIDFRIAGDDIQFVEIELDPGETVIAEAGSMMHKSPSVEMQAIMGDGSSDGLMGKLLGAGRRMITGESLFLTAFTQQQHGKGVVAFAAPYPGKIIPVSLDKMGGRLICQRDAFLCAAKGVAIGIHFQRRILTGLFGGEGFIMQRLDGDGLAFVHAGGTINEHVLQPGEALHVDAGCLVAHEASVDFDIRSVGSLKSMFFAGEGVFFAELVGPGRVWTQSMPFSRLAGKIFAQMPRVTVRQQ